MPSISSFHKRFTELASQYFLSNDAGILHYTGKNSIYEYLNDHYRGICPSESTFKKWQAGKSMPAVEQLDMLCEFFDCDLTYLLGTHDGYLDRQGDVLTDKIEKYIFETYGLGKKTLQFLKNSKRLAIDSSEDALPRNAASEAESFSALLNRLLQKEPWLITNLLQIINAKSLNLSDHGFSQSGNDTITDNLRANNDVNYSLALLSIRLKKILEDTNYVPNANNPLDPYDPRISDSDVNEFISTLLSSRLKWLNDENDLLTKIITEGPLTQDELDEITSRYYSEEQTGSE